MSWPMVKLGEIGSFRAGFGFPEKFQGKVNGDFPFAKVGDISKVARTGNKYIETANNFVDKEDLPLLKAKTVPKGTIVFAKIGEAISQNFRAISSKEMLIDNNTMGLVPNIEIIDLDYLYHFMCKLDLYKYAGITTVPALRKSTLEEIEIPLPPLAEQKRIAAILDKADAIRRKRQQAIQLADDFLRAIFLEMFGDPVTNPKGWEVIPLGSFCTLQGGYAFKSDEFSDEGIPLLKITNVHFEDAIWDDISYLPEEKLTEKSNFALERGDLVMAMTRPVIQSLNSVKVIEIKESDIPSLLNQRVGRFKGYTNVLNKNFLKYFLYSDYFKTEVEKLCSVALQPNVSSKQIESIKCCVPDLHVQEEFSRTVEIVSQMLSKLHSFSKNNMLEALNQKAFSGQL